MATRHECNQKKLLNKESGLMKTQRPPEHHPGTPRRPAPEYGLLDCTNSQLRFTDHGLLSLFYFVDQCLALGWSLVGICNTACRGCESAVLQCTPAWLKKRANGKPPAVAPSIKVEKNAVAVTKRCSSHCIRNKALCISPSKSTSVSPSYSLTNVA